MSKLICPDCGGSDVVKTLDGWCYCESCEREGETAEFDSAVHPELYNAWLVNLMGQDWVDRNFPQGVGA